MGPCQRIERLVALYLEETFEMAQYTTQWPYYVKAVAPIPPFDLTRQIHPKFQAFFLRVLIKRPGSLYRYDPHVDIVGHSRR